MLTRKPQTSVKRNRQAGFSLLEMIVATTIFIMVTGSIYGLLELGREDRNRTSRRGDTQKNARIAMYLIGRDVMNSGLGYHKTGALVPDDFVKNRLGVPLESGTGRDMLTSIVGGNNVFSNRFLSASEKTDSIAFLYRDLDFNNGQAIVVTDEVGNTGASKTVLQSNAADTAAVTNNMLFLAETKSSQAVEMITSKDTATNRLNIDALDNIGLNQSRNGTNGNILRKCASVSDTNCTTYTGITGGQILLKKVEMVSYQVSNDGTFLRTVYGNNPDEPASNQIQQRAIAYGVQNFQVKYQLKNGTIVDDPVVGTDGLRGTADDTPLSMNDVRYISIAMTVSSTELDENGAAEVLTLNSTFSLRNLSYDEK